MVLVVGWSCKKQTCAWLFPQMIINQMPDAVAIKREKEILEGFCAFYKRAFGSPAQLLSLPDAEHPGKGLADGILLLNGVEWDAEVGSNDNYKDQRRDLGRVRQIEAVVKPYLSRFFPNDTIIVLVTGAEVPNGIESQLPVLCSTAREILEPLPQQFENWQKVPGFPFIEVCKNEVIGHPYLAVHGLVKNRDKKPLVDQVRNLMETKEKQQKRRAMSGRPAVLLIDLWDISLSNHQHA